MRRLTIFEHISLDGVLQTTDDDGTFAYADWTVPYRSPEGRAALAELHGDRFDLLLGRRTYDQWSAFWPSAPSGPMADVLNRATKYVVTHRPDDLAWGPCEAVDADVEAGIRRIKARDGSDLICWGSSTLTTMLLERGLADGLQLIVYPVLLGIGKRLFAPGGSPRSFELVAAKTLASGIVLLTYALRGSLRS